MITASALRHRVTLTLIARDRDTMGGVTESASSSVDVWASVEPVDASERFEKAGLTVRPTHRITIRWRPNVTHRDRVMFRDRRFDILSARDPDERRVWLEMLVAAQEAGA